jgi:lysophospholipase L1-like esterase
MDAKPTPLHPSSLASLTEATDPYCLDPGTERSLLAGAPWRRLVVMGDSVALGVGDPVDGYRDLSWADRLALALAPRPDRRRSPAYVNLGVRGSRAAEIRATQLEPALAFRPDLVAVTAGGNDMLSRRFDAEAVREEIEAVVSPLRATGADVITFGLFDISRAPFVPDEMREGLRDRNHRLGEITREVADRHGALHVSFLSHPASSDAATYSADLLHVNRRGHAIVATEVIRSLSSWVSRATHSVGA